MLLVVIKEDIKIGGCKREGYIEGQMIHCGNT